MRLGVTLSNPAERMKAVASVPELLRVLLPAKRQQYPARCTWPIFLSITQGRPDSLNGPWSLQSVSNNLDNRWTKLSRRL